MTSGPTSQARSPGRLRGEDQGSVGPPAIEVLGELGRPFDSDRPGRGPGSGPGSPQARTGSRRPRVEDPPGVAPASGHGQGGGSSLGSASRPREVESGGGRSGPRAGRPRAQYRSARWRSAGPRDRRLTRGRRGPGAARGPCRRASPRHRSGRSWHRRSQSTARLKSSSIGVPSAVSRTFDGLRSPWATPTAEGVIERLGQPGDDPGHRLGVGQPRQGLASRPHRGRRQDTRAPRRGRGPPAGRARRRPASAPRRSARTAESVAPPRNGMEISWNAPSPIRPVPEHLDDVRVPRPRQQAGLGRQPGRDLHDHEPVVEVGLLGEEDAGEAPPSQLAEQLIRADLVARPRAERCGSAQSRSGRRSRGRRASRRAARATRACSGNRRQIIRRVGFQPGGLGQAVTRGRPARPREARSAPQPARYSSAEASRRAPSGR